MILAQYLLIIRLANGKKSCESEYVLSNLPMKKKKFTTYTTNKKYLATISRCVFSTVNFHITTHQQIQQTNGFLSEYVNILVLKLPCVLKLEPDFTIVRFSTSKSQVMSFNVLRIVETFPTFVTFIQSLPCMYKLMLLWIWIICKYLTTVCATERFFTCVSQQVSPYISTLYVPLPYVMHMRGFSPVHESPCFFSSLLVTNPVPQSWHKCGISLQCVSCYEPTDCRHDCSLCRSQHTHIHPIITITDKSACPVRHSTRHCVHMKSVDTRFSLTSSHWGLTNKTFPATGWRIFIIILQQRKNLPILIQNNQQLRMV